LPTAPKVHNNNILFLIFRKMSMVPPWRAAHNTFQKSRFLFRLTLKIGDVFAARISETEGFAGLQKCGGAKYRRGRKPERFFAEPITAERLLCANRVLDEVIFAFIIYSS